MIYILEKSPNMKMFTSKNTQTFSQKYANFYLLMCSSIVINTYFIRRRTPATSRSRSGSVTNLQSLPQLINRFVSSCLKKNHVISVYMQLQHYKTCNDSFLQTHTEIHYIYNLKEPSRAYQKVRFIMF